MNADGTNAEARRRILVVEDDSAILGMLAGMLGSSGLEVEQAADGSEGLAQATHAAPDLIITDIRMPVMDGWQFLEECRNLASCEAVPVIVMSAAPAAKQHDDLHVNAYVSKPFDVDELLGAVEQLLLTPAAMLAYASSRWQTNGNHDGHSQTCRQQR